MLIQFCSFRSNDFANVWLFFQFIFLFAYSGQWMFEKVPVLNFCCLAKNDTTLLKHLEQTHWNSYDYAVSICSSFLKHFQDKFGRMLSAVPIELTMALNQFWGSIRLYFLFSQDTLSTLIQLGPYSSNFCPLLMVLFKSDNLFWG